MAIYFIDYENVGSTGIECVDKLDAGNVVHIFYSKKADTMKIGQVIQLMNVKAKVEFHDVTMRGQKNALDFQLIAMLYFTKQENETCYIISKDTGYDAAISFGKKIGALNVFRKACILDAYNFDIHPAGKRDHAQAQDGRRRRPSEEAEASDRSRREPERAAQTDALQLQEEEQQAQMVSEPAEEISEPVPVPVSEEAAVTGPQEPVREAEDPEELTTVAGDLQEAQRLADQMMADAYRMEEEGRPVSEMDEEASKLFGEAQEAFSAASQLSILEHSFGGLFDYGLADDMNFDEDQSAAALPFPMNEPAPEAGEEAADEETGSREAAQEKPQEEGEPSLQEQQEEEPVSAEPVRKEESPRPDPELSPEETAGQESESSPAPAEGQEAGDGQGAGDEPRSSRRRNRSSRGRRKQNGHEGGQAAEETHEEADHAQAAPAEDPDPSAQEKQEGKEKEKNRDRGKKGDARGREEEPVYVRNPAFEEKVGQVMTVGGFTLPEEEIVLIAEALKTTKNKNQFYQFFRKRKGEAAGREFYIQIRGQYESLKVLKNEA